MNTTIPQLAIALLFGSVCLSSYAQETLEPQAGALLLRNGEVIEGGVSFEGDYCTVVLERGELRVRRDRVRAVEANIDAIYRKHIVPNTPPGPEGAWKRADWSLRNGLIGYAASEITEAARHFPNEPRLDVLRERLAAARRPAKPKSTKTAHQDAEPATASQVHTSAIDSKSLEAFTVAVQPLLLNRCATAGCHGKASKNAYQLTRGVEGRAMLRRMTLANLESTLRFIDRKRPAASPLLTKTIRPHGGAKQAVFLAMHRRQYELLAGWVERLAIDTNAKPVVASGSQPTSRQPRGIKSDTKTLGRPLPAPFDTRGGNGKRPPSSKSKPLATPETVDDPYDPERFNRRYFKSKSPSNKAPANLPKSDDQHSSP